MPRTALGPAIAGFLGDASVIEVMLHPDGRLWIYEGGEPASLVVGEVDVIGRSGLPVGDADRKSAGAGAESGNARDKGIEGMGSGKFRHGGDCRYTTTWQYSDAASGK